MGTNNRIAKALGELAALPPSEIRTVPVSYFRHVLIDVRLRRGLERQELANSVGVGFHTISNWELGQFVPNLANAEAWANALGYELHMLLVPKYLKKK